MSRSWSGSGNVGGARMDVRMSSWGRRRLGTSPRKRAIHQRYRRGPKISSETPTSTHNSSYSRPHHGQYQWSSFFPDWTYLHSVCLHGVQSIFALVYVNHYDSSTSISSKSLSSVSSSPTSSLLEVSELGTSVLTTNCLSLRNTSSSHASMPLIAPTKYR